MQKSFKKVTTRLDNAKRRHPLSSTYNSMIQRCYNKSANHFDSYGGRGIKVCNRWLSRQDYAVGFWNFVSDMGERPEGTSLDRIDNNGDYTPENCRWATRKEQASNQRSNIIIEFSGESKCLKDWAVELGINYGTMRSRYKRGLSVEKILYKGRLRKKEWQ